MSLNKKIIVKTITFVGLFAAAITSASFLKFENQIDILRYDEAYYMPAENSNNNLYAKITGRLRVSKINQITDKQFFAVKDHPRESTFDDQNPAYSSMPPSELGSFIGFIFNEKGEAIINRRYSKPEIKNNQLECKSNPYSENFRYLPASLWMVVELKNSEEILWAANNQKSIYFRTKYLINDLQLHLDYKSALINFKKTDDGILKWQSVSDIVPMYIGGRVENCGSIRQGYITIRNFSGDNEALYLCGEGDGDSGSQINDYRCVLKINTSSQAYVSA